MSLWSLNKRQTPVQTQSVVQSCLYICLGFCDILSLNLFSPACFLLGHLVPLSRVTAEKKEDSKERGHGNREQEQERKEGRVQALK